MSKASCIKNAAALASSDLDQIDRWSIAFPLCNWRVYMGGSQIWALDVDAKGETHAHDGIAAMASLVKIHGPLPPGPRARSGGGGVGVFFRHAGERIIGEGGKPLPGIDPRRGAQSQTIPPSIHTITGRPYRWVTPPWEVTPPLAPGWLLRLLEPPPEPAWRPVVVPTGDHARNRLHRAAFAVMDAAAGSRNETLNRRAYQVGRMIGAGLLDEREAASALFDAARHAGLDALETRNTIRSGFTSGRRNPVERSRA